MKKKPAPQESNDFEDAFIREIDEEIKNEKLKRIWDKYGLFIILFVVLAVFSAVSFESIKAWKDKKNQENSDTLAYALQLQNLGKFDDAQKVLNSLVDNDAGIYADIAQMQIANLFLQQKKTDEAIKVLEKITAQDDFNPQMKDIAVIKLASYKLDNAPAEEIKNMLQPLLVQQNLLANSAKEILAMLAIREKDFSTAKSLYQEISINPKATDTMRTRALNMLNTL